MRALVTVFLALAGTICGAQATSQTPSGAARAPQGTVSVSDQLRSSDQASTAGYVLGPGDQVTVFITDAEQNSDRPLLVDMTGHIRLALVGRVHVAGLTVTQLEETLVESLKKYFKRPDVTVSIAEYGSQPVSVIGEVKNPGVHQVRGRKTLVEMLALAGGLEDTAGSTVKITRRAEWGAIPLANAITDPTGQFSVAEVALKPLIGAKNPEVNILVRPQDVISVPRADTVYVIGQVVRSGGFQLNEHENISVLQALSMAGGLDRMAKPQDARILRLEPGSPSRTEIAVDLRELLDGRKSDVPMQPEDILFVPDNIPKRAFVRGLEAALQMATGVVIWRR